jgi:hypothetical protein
MRIATAVCCLMFIVTMSKGVAYRENVNPLQLDSAVQDTLNNWLDTQAKTPEKYVVGLYSKHDVVFLGEQHRVKHDVLLVQSLIAPLYKAGVRVLATEFGRREDQLLIDSLLVLPQWNEELAREIVFRQYIWWGYREYVDIYRAAWTLNRSLPTGALPFRIFGVNDSPDWSAIKTEADRNDPDVMRRVWQGGGEDKWARVILDAVRSGEKVLVHCGIHHAFTKYRQPVVLSGGFVRFDPTLRCGNHVFKALGERVATVFLHAPWNGLGGYGSPMVRPAGGIIDELMLTRGPRPVGFDVREGPFGVLHIEDAVYCHGYEHFTLADFCDGWIYTKPIFEYEGVTPILNWVNEGNLERARSQSPDPAFRSATAERFNSGIARDADIGRRWGHL